MPLKHRLARLEAAIAARQRPIDQRNDFEEMWRGLQELHADPVHLGLLRELRALMDERGLTVERLGDDPDGAEIIARLEAHRAVKGAAA